MPKIVYVERNFAPKSERIIDQANDIINQYATQGFELTLRQLYYQFVARGIIPNTARSYYNLGSIVNDARMAGRIDWNHITDRTRNLKENPHWDDPSGVIETAAATYGIDMWAHQRYRPEVWIEKDALIGVIEDVCDKFDVPYFSCRGYTSQSEMWKAGRRLARHANNLQTPVILHLGDHDPSGMDMSRDIFDRLKIFMGGVEVKRLALNMDQINKYNPPPNPTKITDSRASAYIVKFGNNSWELDALEPKVMVRLITSAIKKLINKKWWADDERRLKQERELLTTASDRWPEIQRFLQEEE